MLLPFAFISYYSTRTIHHHHQNIKLCKFSRVCVNMPQCMSNRTHYYSRILFHKHKVQLLLLLNDASADIHNLSISLFKVILKANTHSLLTVHSFLSLLFIFFYIFYIFICVHSSPDNELFSLYTNMLSIYALWWLEHKHRTLFCTLRCTRKKKILKWNG